MIQVQTNLTVIDNSGAKTAKCIHLFGGYKKRSSTSTSQILISIQDIKKKKVKKPGVKKGAIFNAVILRTKKKIRRKTNNKFVFKKNTIVLLTNKLRPLGTRISGPVTKELRYSKFMKVATLASGLI
jgi:large subunit ribosomal protein L14